MKPLFYLISLIICMIAFTKVSFITAKSTSREASSKSVERFNGASEPVTTKDVMEMQEKRYEQFLQIQKDLSDKSLQAQKEISDKTIQSVIQEHQSFQALISVGAAIATLLAAVFGWLLQREYRKLSKSVDEKLGQVNNIAKEIGGRQIEVSSLRTDLKKLQDDAEALKNDKGLWVDKYQADIDKITEQAEAIKEQANEYKNQFMIYKLQLKCLSPNADERLRAAQYLSEQAKREMGALVIPILLEFLQKKEAETPDVLAEALYGLSFRPREIGQDYRAIELIVETSYNQADSVRRQAMATMETLVPIPSQFRNRLKEMWGEEKS